MELVQENGKVVGVIAQDTTDQHYIKINVSKGVIMCTGGFFSQTYPNLMTGLACGRTMTFGRRAAKKVAAL